MLCIWGVCVYRVYVYIGCMYVYIYMCVCVCVYVCTAASSMLTILYLKYFMTHCKTYN